MRYEVKGAWRATGTEAVLVIDAASAASAESQANSRGLLVTACEQISIAKSIPRMDDITPPASPTKHGAQASVRTHRPAGAARPVTSSAGPAGTNPPPSEVVVGRQIREWAWVVTGFGWLFLVGCGVGAITSAGMAATGELGRLDWGGRSVLIVGVFLVNLLAAGLITMGKPERFAAAFMNTSPSSGSSGSSQTSRPRRLAQRFQLLGDVRGRTRAEVVAAVGTPISVTAMLEETLVQWGEGGYLIALMFDGPDDTAKCRGISSEISA